MQSNAKCQLLLVLSLISSDTSIMIEFLPNEILLIIFSNLESKDLINVSEVSRRFHSIATDPLLWRHFNIGELFSIEEQINLLRLPRFQKLKSFELNNSDINGEVDPNYTIENINNILKLLGDMDIEMVTFRMFDFRGLDPKLLSEVVTDTKSVRLEANTLGDLEEEQLVEILENIPGGSIKYLQLDHVVLYNICPKKLARAINSLEALYCEYCFYSPEQLSEMFRDMSEDTKLSIFSCRTTTSLSSLAPATLAQALNNLECEAANFSAEQMSELFLQMSTETRVSSMFLAGPDTPESPLVQAIPANVLSSALGQLEEFSAPQLEFTPAQIKTVLDIVATESSKLRRIDLGSTHQPPLANMDLGTLRKVIYKIENNAFKLLIQDKVIELYDETIWSMREELRAKKQELCVSRRGQGVVTRGRLQLPSKHASYHRFKARASSKRTMKPRIHVKIKAL